MSARLHVGTSGWQDDHWRGVLYPEDLPRDRWFERYADTFATVEINSTFYNLPEAKVFEVWRESGAALVIHDRLDVHAYFNNDLGGHAVPNARDPRRFVERGDTRRRKESS